LDGIIERCVALIVVSIGKQDESLAESSGAGQREHLIAASCVGGVIERGTTAGRKFADSARQQIAVVRVSLSEVRRDIETHHESLIHLGAEDRQQKLDGGVLFELKSRTD